MGLTGKILLFTSLLVLGLMVAILAITSTQAEEMAAQAAQRGLEGARDGWQAFRAEQDERLQLGVRVLGNDPALKAAVQTGDLATVRDLLVERGHDLGADFFMATDPSGMVVARSDRPGGGEDMSRDPLVRSALEDTTAAGSTWQQDRELYHAVAAPMRFGEDLVGVLVAGYRVDPRLARRVAGLAGGEILFVTRGRGDVPTLAASSVEEQGEVPTSVLRHLLDAPEQQPIEVALHGDRHLGLHLPMKRADGSTAGHIAILRSLSRELAPLSRFRRTVTLVSLAVLAIAVALAWVASTRITNPLRVLVGAVDEARHGTWSPVDVGSGDEIGSLAGAFNRMQEAIAAREDQIRRMALQDPVTLLANRALFNDRLHHAFSLARRGHTPLTVLLVDLERFRDVNDTYGHSAGDAVLLEVATRLRSLLRASDTVARLASDEFAILLPTVASDEGRRIARKILADLEPPFSVDGRTLHVRCSIGVASSPQHGDEPAALLRHADLALQAARKSGAGFAVYDAGYGEGGQERLPLLEELHAAVDKGQLVVHYQPKMDLRSGNLVAVEALVRWEHPERGLLGPARFVPLAEQTGFIHRVTRAVIERAVVQVATWRRAGLEIEVAINISARDLMDRELLPLLESLLSEQSLEPGIVWLEITESSVMEDPAQSLEVMRRLRAMGLRLSIDDFGTGYSSLAYLKRLPVNELKIDKSFVSGLTTDVDDATIVRTTIELGHTMGLRVVAEGVETAAAWDALAGMGCDLAQGYHISYPLPPADLERFARARMGPEPARTM
jgi:diguanylate cyclase (GGDEF)-like protein